MIALLGMIGLWLAFFGSLVQASHCWQHHYKIIAIGIAAALSLAFGSLVVGYITSDFSIVNVYENSHSLKPLIYKITGTWGNHEGSMLLLILILAYYHLWLCITHQDSLSSPSAIRLHGLLLVAFLGFIMFTSSPFETLPQTPENGLGLNPLLQDIGLAIHPPILYIGYTGMSVIFVLAIDAMINQRVNKQWAANLMPWVMFGWSFLTLGIGLGSWWAYRELGWGGFWFWDPVENVSLMPWLTATALLHSVIALKKRNQFASWVVLLSLLTFILSLVGIFLVRSGILTSVHAFASDPSRGLYILMLLGLCAGGSLFLFSRYVINTSTTKGQHSFVSRETGLLINNIFLMSMCATILLGTIYPIALQAIAGIHVSVAAPYFNSITTILLPLFAILMTLAPAIAWGKDKPTRHIKWLVISVIIAGGICVKLTPYPLAFLGWLIVVYMVIHTYQTTKIQWPMVLAHIGFGLLIVGVVTTTSGSIEKQTMLSHSESVPLGPYTITLNDMFIASNDNYLTRLGHFSLFKGNTELALLKPEVRFYPIASDNTTEAAIYRDGLSDIYLVMGDTNGEDRFAIRAYVRPWVNLLWIAGIMITLAGLCHLYLRRVK